MATLNNILYGNRWKSLVVLIAAILLLPFFVHKPHIYTLLILIGLYSIITIGLSLLLGYAGQISLGHAAFFGIGAYTSGILTTKATISPWLAIIIGIIITFSLAYLIGIPILKLKGHFLAIATVGFNIIIYVLLVGFSGFTGGPLGLQGIPKLSLFGLDLGNTLYFYYFIWATVIVVILFTTNIVRSHIGRVLRSIGDSEIATQMLGVNIAKYKVFIFAVSAAYASLAGSLYAHYINFIAPPTFNVDFSIILLIMVMVGGVHSIWGAVLGTAVIMFLQEFIRHIGSTYLNISGPVEIVVYGLCVVLVMVFMPRGLISLFTSLWDKITIRKISPHKDTQVEEKGA